MQYCCCVPSEGALNLHQSSLRGGSSSGTLCVAAASSNPLSHSEAYGKPLLGVALEVSVGSVDHLAAQFLGTCGPKVATRTPPRPLQLVVAVQGGATGRWQLAPGLEARLRGLLCQCGIAPEPAIRFASTLLGSWHFPGGCKARGTWHTCSLGWRKLQVLGSCEKPSKTCCSRPERPATTFLNLFCRSSSSIRASSK